MEVTGISSAASQSATPSEAPVPKAAPIEAKEATKNPEESNLESAQLAQRQASTESGKGELLDIFA